jgi:uracil-DNA glycosylase family 4
MEIARVKRKAYQDQEYWGRPIPGFGDPQARLVIVGLAPGAHGANRTGRIFTGDRSGEWLYRALHKAGFSNQPVSQSPADGLELRDAYITCAVKCAPPDNRPNLEEIQSCCRYLIREFEIFHGRRVWIALGAIAMNSLWSVFGMKEKRPKFAHGQSIDLGSGGLLLLSYHPSQQNTFTGRLTEPMFDAVFSAARSAVKKIPPSTK